MNSKDGLIKSYHPGRGFSEENLCFSNDPAHLKVSWIIKALSLVCFVPSRLLTEDGNDELMTAKVFVHIAILIVNIFT